jgi:hypothetical protein
MHRTGKYKLLNLIFGLFPFVAAILIRMMHEDSGPIQLWLSIVRLLLPSDPMVDEYATDSDGLRERSSIADYAQ